MYMEQTSHHPPISNFLMEGPPECPYQLYGHIEFRIGMNRTMTACTYSAPGKSTLRWPNGTVVEFGSKVIEISGLMNKEKSLNVIEAS